ncbi:hypothetical protein [Deinococcus sp. QL22]|uniref:hypothetical protein n=1 Tax=Deinococcus sp. QL22 TaxID=2939437 RepID=UPI00201740BE|nr:hypothetical protein [Deinococcus sp. QL22]UQN09336.1 hypothetical protein M1R55_22485 [Deinococcus sp. QL22]
MNSSPRAQWAEEALAGVGREESEALQVCFQAFAPLLFTLAERAQVADPERAVEAVLRDLVTHHFGWPRSGLSARVWVIGMAQRRFQLLRQIPPSIAV